MAGLEKYEVLVILPDAMKEDAFEEAMGKIKTEIQKCDGALRNASRMGRRQFARALGKHKAGQYVRIDFDMDVANLAKLRMRLKLLDGIVRYQLVRAGKPQAPAPAAPAAPAAAAAPPAAGGQG